MKNIKIPVATNEEVVALDGLLERFVNKDYIGFTFVNNNNIATVELV